MVRINPARPAPGQLVNTDSLRRSEFVLPFSISLESLTTLINEKLPSGEIASGSGSSGNTTRYSYSVRRNAPVRVSANGNELEFQVPLQIVARGSYKACIGFWRGGRCCSAPRPWPLRGCFPGITQTEHGDASPTVYLKLRVSLAVDGSYQVQATTKLDATIGGDTHLHIDLLGNLIRINIDIKDKLNAPLQKFVNDYQDDINSKVAELIAAVEVKDKLEQYWMEMQRPLKYDFAYVNFTPEDVLFENLKVENGNLQLSVGLRGIVDVSDKPRIAPADSLPPLTLISNAAPSFHIYLPVGARFKTLDSLINKHVGGRKLRKGKDWVYIQGVKNRGVKMGEATAILSEIDFKAKAKGIRAKGKLYFTSIPAIDTAQRLVYAQDFLMTPATNSAILNRGVPFLIDNFFYAQIKDQMRYSYAKDIDKYMAIVNAYVKNVQLGPINLEGELTDLRTDGIVILDDRIQIVVSAEGHFAGSVILE
jgi:hypothetical protein